MNERWMERLERRRMLSADVLTYHNDNALNGLNSAETALAPGNVNAATFGKLFSYPVDGEAYAQPLVKGNVVFVATEHDSVYAFRADGLASGPIWHISFIDPASKVTTVSSTDVGTTNLGPEVGITSTPVIDGATNTMYVVAETKEVSSRGKTNFVQRLHALDLATGAEKFGGPVVVTATVAGNGVGNDGHGHISYLTLRQNQRSSLTLVNGVVYVASASHADIGPYHGWILGYNASTLQQVAALNVTPNGSLGGIWQSGAGLSADAAGNLFVTTGNGTFDGNTGRRDFGDAALRLSGSLGVSDYFVPFNQADLQARDKDLGSGGMLLLPDSAGNGTHPHLAVFAGKEGRLYLVDRDRLGEFNSTADQVVQWSTTAITAAFDTPAFFNGMLYYVASGDHLKAFPVSNARIGRAGSISTQTFGFPGATPSISSNGASDGIVWLLTNDVAGRAIVEAFDAGNVTTPIYTSDQAAGARDAFGNYVKFTSPVISNGRVFAATKNALAVFGELPAVTAQLTSAPTLTAAAASYRFTVTYHSSVGFDAATFAGDDIVITTPKGFSAAASVVSVKSGKHPSTQVVTYSVAGSGGMWDAADNGTYTVQVKGGAVQDLLGNAAQPWAIGSFAVRIA